MKKTMRKFGFVLSSLFVFIMFSGTLAGQSSDDRVLLDIAGDKVTAGEFMYVYQKNNFSQEPSTPEAIREYLDLYINFRLKVKEAEELGLDTAASFKKELEGYRKQLAQPYFTDESIKESLLKEAYERKLSDVRASHILFRLDKNASPEDTLAAYQKAMEAHKRIMSGEDFGKVAAEVSEDPSARDTEASQYRPARKGNLGDLGYFTVFDMVYPFETGAYTTPVGEVSMPVRTDFGYHLIKVVSRTPALGQAQVAHVFVAIPPNATAQDSLQKKMKIDAAYDQLMTGASFEDVVRDYTEDKGSVGNGGKLPWFGSNRMVPEFIDVTRNLADSGAISKPFSTAFGWHIVKLIGKKPVGSFEAEQAELKSRLEKDVRNKLSEQAVLDKIKADYGFKEHLKNLDPVFATLDSTVLKGEWSAEKAAGLDKVLFTLGDKKFTQQDFAQYLAQKQTKRGIADMKVFFDDSYKSFVTERCIAYEDKKLEEKYPEFRMLVQEYHDGILLFDLTDRNVWSKAVKDTTGLREFFATQPGKYMWGQRLHATVVTILKPANVNSDEIRKMFSSGTPVEEILARYNTDTTLNILAETAKFSPGDSPVIDKIKWKSGLSPMIDSPEGPGFAYVYALIEPEPKSLDEARGLATADYQAYLEEQWINDLRSRYAVTINEEVLSTLK